MQKKIQKLYKFNPSYTNPLKKGNEEEEGREEKMNPSGLKAIMTTPLENKSNVII